MLGRGDFRRMQAAVDMHKRLAFASQAPRVRIAQAFGVRQSPGKLKDLQSRGIHPAGGERMAKEQPALSQLYNQISELASPSFRDEVRGRIRATRTRDPKLLAQLPMPVLFVTGDEDWVFPPAAGPALAKLAPRGSAVRVPAAGHSVYFERAAKFNEIIGRVL